jgi:hypothetical protein
MSETDAITSAERTHIVRERQFYLNGDRESSVIKALCQLARESATGQLILDLNCGGIGGIRFREEQKVTFPEK